MCLDRYESDLLDLLRVLLDYKMSADTNVCAYDMVPHGVPHQAALDVPVVESLFIALVNTLFLSYI